MESASSSGCRRTTLAQSLSNKWSMPLDMPLDSAPANLRAGERACCRNYLGKGARTRDRQTQNKRQGGGGEEQTTLLDGPSNLASTQHTLSLGNKDMAPCEVSARVHASPQTIWNTCFEPMKWEVSQPRLLRVVTCPSNLDSLRRHTLHRSGIPISKS